MSYYHPSHSRPVYRNDILLIAPDTWPQVKEYYLFDPPNELEFYKQYVCSKEQTSFYNNFFHKYKHIHDIDINKYLEIKDSYVNYHKSIQVAIQKMREASYFKEEDEGNEEEIVKDIFTKFKKPIKGVFAKLFIPAGTILGEWDALVQTDENDPHKDIISKDGCYSKVYYRINDLNYYDFQQEYEYCHKENIKKNTNIRSLVINKDRYFQAIKDIHPGEELSCLYGNYWFNFHSNKIIHNWKNPKEELKQYEQRKNGFFLATQQVQKWIPGTKLDLSGLSLTKLPQLPENLTDLNIDYNELETLPSLPPSLEILWCSFNKLKSLPNLPLSLRQIICFGNKLESLPILPNSLEELLCSGNYIKELPLLPKSLQVLDVRLNRLRKVSELPESLTEFMCCHNFLTSLPNLPPNLRFLDYLDYDDSEYNNIQTLPKLPATLVYLNKQKINQLKEEKEVKKFLSFFRISGKA